MNGTDLFGFMSMADNHEERVVAHHEKGGLMVDTCAVTDSRQPYETAVSHPSYNEGKWVIVELYPSKEDAQKGHDRWVEQMTTNPLPIKLEDVSTAMTAEMLDELGNWREHTNTEKEDE